MKENTLVQKRSSESKRFKIEGQFLCIESKTWHEEKKWQVRLEKIGNQKYFKKESKKPRIFGAIVILLIAFLCTIGALFSHIAQNWTQIILCDLGFFGFSIIILSKKLKSKVFLIGGEVDIEFYADSPDTESVEKFINYLIDCSNKYILEKYGIIDPDLPEDTQMNLLYWLRTRELINQEEYEDLKKQYKISRLI